MLIGIIVVAADIAWLLLSLLLLLSCCLFVCLSCVVCCLLFVACCLLRVACCLLNVFGSFWELFLESICKGDYPLVPGRHSGSQSSWMSLGSVGNGSEGRSCSCGVPWSLGVPGCPWSSLGVGS